VAQAYTKKPKSPHAHGASEIWERPAVYRTLAGEQRRVGGCLKALRKEQGLTLEKAAEAIGIHPVHLQRVASGASNVTLGTLTAIALAYRIPLAELFETPAPEIPKKENPRPKARYPKARGRK